jgi:hypothetical protein
MVNLKVTNLQGDDVHQQKNIPFGQNGSVRVDAIC